MGVWLGERLGECLGKWLEREGKFGSRQYPAKLVFSHMEYFQGCFELNSNNQKIKCKFLSHLLPSLPFNEV